VALVVASFVLQSGWRLMGPVGGFPGIGAATLGGIIALLAIAREERAIAVYGALLPFLGAVAFVFAELIGFG
jgi:hypothetical protein